jgi:hypothetical protein
MAMTPVAGVTEPNVCAGAMANQKIDRLLQEIPTARSAECDGDHNSTPYQPTFQQAVVQFFEGQWRLRACLRTPQT